MKADVSKPAPVVVLVDNRTRDLDVSTLIAYQLNKLGVECYLEPLEAFRAVVGAYRPGLIIFNHLYASHLIRWSKRLRDIGVLTAVLSNEGMLWTSDSLRTQSGANHGDGHVDYFFCWNEMHREAIIRNGVFPSARKEVIGVPRFDFYFEPWARLFRKPREASARPRVLFCTNAGLAKFWELPREFGDRHFAQWGNYSTNESKHWEKIEAKWKARNRFVEYAAALAASGRYDIVFRPHPAEDSEFYEKWIASLPADQQARVTLDKSSNVSELILDCDIQVADESCTTGTESWIARKPTVGLVFHRNSPLFFEERSRGHPHCDNPEELADIIDRQLVTPVSAELEEVRRLHLQKWCNGPDGHSTERIVRIVNEAVRTKAPSDWSKLDWGDYRRAFKLGAYRSIGQAYQFDPLMWLKRMIAPERYAMKERAYRKSIMPRDTTASRERFERLLG